MIVVDASALVDAVVDSGEVGESARSRLEGERTFAPHLIDLEIASMLKRVERSGHDLAASAEQVLGALAVFPLRRMPSVPLLGRIWELRHNLTIYDASYAALAEAIDVPLVTSDAAFAVAPSLRCKVDLLTTR